MDTTLTLLVAGLIAATTGQVDDFSCPDSLEGFYPHLYSCDKYWHCEEGEAELRTCGNGLGFIDTDPTFTLEQCNELHLVECGERTELEPPISTPHCPRAWGTYEDQEDCGVFWVCQDGKANRYECPPGLAYDKESRGCRWADQVPECSGPVVVDEEGGEFQCPKSAPGIFTKHAHPSDCRQYYLCISGVPREYGCPLGAVFNTGTGNGVDGECTDPEQVPECRDYYGDQEFDVRQLSSNGFSSQQQVREGAAQTRPRGRNTVPRVSVEQKESSRDRETVELSRPAPAALQEILDRPSAGRTRPASPVQVEDSQRPLLPTRLEVVTTQRPARLEVVTNRPNFRNNFRQTLQPTSPTTTESSFRARPFPSRFNTNTNNSPRLSLGSNRFRPTPPPSTTTTTTAPPPPPTTSRPSGLPAPVKAAPGPNGEDYYYYYYYYDDEEEQV